MTRLARIWARMVAVVVVGAAAIALAGCGGTHTPASRGARPAMADFTPAERRAIAAQRHAQRAQFSSTALDRSLARLRGRARRRAVVRAAERAILRDALQRYATHELDKRARYVTCSVSPDDQPLLAREPDAPILRYQCLAVTFRVDTKPPTLAGIDFVTRIDFSAPRFAWCLFVPVGGEGTHAAATLMAPPPPACIADPPR